MVIRSGRMSPFLNRGTAGLLSELARLSLHSLTTFTLKLPEVALAFGEPGSHVTLNKSQVKLGGELSAKL